MHRLKPDPSTNQQADRLLMGSNLTLWELQRKAQLTSQLQLVYQRRYASNVRATTASNVLDLAPICTVCSYAIHLIPQQPLLPSTLAVLHLVLHRNKILLQLLHCAWTSCQEASR
jgi:hypothetical protein